MFLLLLLDLLLLLVELLVPIFWLFSSSPSDFVEGDTNNGLLDSGGLLGSSLGDFGVLDLLVESSPGLAPSKLDSLLPLVVQALAFGIYEVMNSTVLGDEFPSSSWEYSVLAKTARICLCDHF